MQIKTMPQNHVERRFEIKSTQEGFLNFGGGNPLSRNNGNKRKSDEFRLPSTFGSTLPITKKPKFSALPEFENNDSPMMDTFEVCGPSVFNHYSANNIQQISNDSNFVQNGRVEELVIDKQRDYNYSLYYGGMSDTGQRSTENESHCVQNGNNHVLEHNAYDDIASINSNINYSSIEKEAVMHIAEPLESNIYSAVINDSNENDHPTTNGYGKFDDYRIYEQQREKRLFNPNHYYYSEEHFETMLNANHGQ